MKLTSLLFAQKGKFTRLLIDLGLLFFLSPLSIYPVGNVIITGGFFATNIDVIKTLKLSKRRLLGLRILAVFAFGFDVIVIRSLESITNITSIIAYLSYAGFMLIAIVTIGNYIFKQTKVDLNTINGGICIFLLLGFLWFSFYRIIYTLDANAFSGIASESEMTFKLLYFSYTTITTLGYGDIVPVNHFAMTLANAEAVFGMMYPAIYIARLVSLYTTQND
ncbi:MAG: ion channel [Microcystaceae cyanobacterium]